MRHEYLFEGGREIILEDRLIRGLMAVTTLAGTVQAVANDYFPDSGFGRACYLAIFSLSAVTAAKNFSDYGNMQNKVYGDPVELAKLVRKP